VDGHEVAPRRAIDETIFGRFTYTCSRRCHTGSCDPRSTPAALMANCCKINQIWAAQAVAQLRITFDALLVLAEHRHRKGDIYVDRSFSWPESVDGFLIRRALVGCAIGTLCPSRDPRSARSARCAMRKDHRDHERAIVRIQNEGIKAESEGFRRLEDFGCQIRWVGYRAEIGTTRRKAVAVGGAMASDGGAENG
jgi:hypothetical protein